MDSRVGVKDSNPSLRGASLPPEWLPSHLEEDVLRSMPSLVTPSP